MRICLDGFQGGEMGVCYAIVKIGENKGNVVRGTFKKEKKKLQIKPKRSHTKRSGTVKKK